MADTIRILPPDLASQIAAGEVVERPASVVKELVENSLDAGATRIDVAIEGGGITAIVISDDGRGMNEEGAKLSLERHATSKLQAIEDLERIGTCGFRGEALPSVASVSRLKISTRDASANEGVELIAEGTTAPTTRPIGAPVGTVIEVRDLFFNVPARRKFLRSSNTESGHIAETLTQVALTRPDVSFTLTRDNRKARAFLRTPSRKERVAQVLDGEELFECSADRGPLRVEAFLSRPTRARQGAGGLKIVVNGRSIRDRALAATIAHAYGSGLERGRYPRGVVYLDLPGTLVDVNVHPAKTEVRFADPRAVSDALYSVVSKQLGSKFAAEQSPTGDGQDHSVSWPSAPRVGWSGAPVKATESQSSAPSERSPWSSEMPRPQLPTGATLHDSQRPEVGRPQLGSDPDRRAYLPPELLDAPAENDRGWKHLRFLHQLRSSYLVCEGDDGLYVLDQHAAAERVLFSKLKSALAEKALPTQRLLFPVQVPTSQNESRLIEEQASVLARLGFDVRSRGDAQASIHGVPHLLQNADPALLLQEALHDFMRGREQGLGDTLDRLLGKMACHAAIRPGDQLESSEAQVLLSSLDDAEANSCTPHGRPIVSFVSWLELDRKTGRS